MAQTIMIQGTMSNVGKSLVCAGLCRIFAQDGYRVAPFKSQNMALNSYVTKEGLEMGRAQVVQAQAAGVTPDVRMNPILLKPESDIGSQVIVNGQVVGRMDAKEYSARKKEYLPEIRAAFESLDHDYDIVVLEGAGSPAEINLKADDIVNMGIAKMAKAPVLLVGDIDRGGVFAQLIGTLELLEPEERERVKGLILNKFRGDPSLLDSGIDMLRERTGITMVDLIPYLDVDLDEEDSLSERLEAEETENLIDLAVIRLPRISNYTDFSPFENMAGVGVRYVDQVDDLKDPDLIFLPGTKSTVSDLAWLKDAGFDQALRTASYDGTPIFGICGGYQMLGEVIKDPYRVEVGASDPILMEGLGLLNVQTTFAREKTRTQAEGEIRGAEGIFRGLNGLTYSGYEIHMGASTTLSGTPGPFISSRNVYGTYIHGLFDNWEISDTIIKALARKKGLDVDRFQGVDVHAFKEQEYNRLADALRQSLQMDEIYRILEEGA